MPPASAPNIPDNLKGTKREGVIRFVFDKKNILKAKYKNYAEKISTFSSKVSIISWIIINSLVLFFIMWIISLTLKHSWFGDIESKNIASVALTMTGGVVGVSYLVIKYRERISAERQEEREINQAADEGIYRAAEFLSSKDPMTQIAGVYALSGIADKYSGDYKQRVVDIFCSFIRMDRDDSTRVVESTIITEIQNHLDFIKVQEGGSLISSKDNSWSECNFDFHGANFLEEFRFNNSLVRGMFRMRNAQFQNKVYLSSVSFGCGADFSECIFHSRVLISRVHHKTATIDFRGADFKTGLVATDLFDEKPLSPSLLNFENAYFRFVGFFENPFQYSFKEGGDYLLTETIDIWNEYHDKDVPHHLRDRFYKSVPKGGSIVPHDTEEEFERYYLENGKNEQPLI